MERGNMTKRNLPSEVFVLSCQDLLAKFDTGEPVDALGEMLDDIPDYLEAIIDLHYELVSVRQQLAATKPL